MKSPPIDNAANEELVRFLAEKFKISRLNIEIVQGRKQKRKIISIKNINQNNIVKTQFLLVNKIVEKYITQIG